MTVWWHENPWRPHEWVLGVCDPVRIVAREQLQLPSCADQVCEQETHARGDEKCEGEDPHAFPRTFLYEGSSSPTNRPAGERMNESVKGAKARHPFEVICSALSKAIWRAPSSALDQA
jgi:hypothetical protein